jgi:hypothetical protein
MIVSVISSRRQPVLGMVPAHQRLGPDDRARHQVDLGLVVHDDLAAGDRRGQLADQAQPLLGVPVARRRVERVAGTVGLGHVHGDVGALHQRLDVLGVLGVDGGADARADEQAHALVVKRLPDRGLQQLGDLLGLDRSGARGEQHGELVAAEACHEVDGRGHRRQAQPDLAQQLVTGLMAESVVELLELIEIDEHDHHVAAGGLGGRHVGGQPGEEHPAVGQVGERVVQRLALQPRGELAQLLLEPAALGLVAQGQDEAADAGVVGVVGGGRVDVAKRAVAVADAQGQPLGEPRARAGAAHVVAQRRPVLGADEVEHRRPEQRVGIVAERRPHRARLPADQELLVDDGDDVGGVVDERAQPPLPGRDALQRGPQRGDQRRDDRQADEAGDRWPHAR